MKSQEGLFFLFCLIKDHCMCLKCFDLVVMSSDEEKKCVCVCVQLLTTASLRSNKQSNCQLISLFAKCGTVSQHCVTCPLFGECLSSYPHTTDAHRNEWQSKQAFSHCTINNAWNSNRNRM